MDDHDADDKTSAYAGGITWDQISAIIEQRRSMNDVALQEMLEVRKRYNADWVIPLPDTDTEPTLPPITPALIAEAIDNVAMLASGTWPWMGSPPLEPSKQKGTKSREYADIRRKVLYGTWHASAGGLVLRRAYRHLGGYATCTIMVRPDFGRGMPVIEIRDPLGTYPEPKAAEDLTPPRNCGYVYTRSAASVRAEWPQACVEHGGPIDDCGHAEEWDLVEWVDEHCTVIGILGPHSPDQATSAQLYQKITGSHPTMELDRFSNPTGICPVVTMPRVTLDRIASQISHTVGMVDLMAKIMALALIAEEKSVFADRYAVGSKNGRPAIVSNGGVWKDGRSGEINILQDVDQVGALQTPASQTSLQMIDRLERNFKVSGTGLVPAMGGETYGALRTGRGIDSMMGAAVDPRVQELQEIMQIGMGHLNRIVFEQWKAYWPDETVVLETGWPGTGALVEFTPSRHVEVTHNTVKYPIPGMDAQGLTVTLGQMLGTGAISLATFRRLHPYIDDPEQEGATRDEEDLELAVMESIKQQAVSGQIPVVYVARIEKHRKSGLDIFEAITKADEETRAEQAATPPPTPEGMGAPPEAMPGLAAGGPGAAMAAMPGQMPVVPPGTESPAVIEGPNASQANLDQLLQSLRAG